MIQPQSPPKPKTTTRGRGIRAALAQEWTHWSTLPLSSFCWFALPTLVLFFVDPLLPPVAYVLQRWAGSSWAWRDRWASIRTWAEPGGWFVGILIALGVLAYAHIWFFPALVALAQGAWRAALPGELSLFPLARGALFARLLLFLPLAPALALLYERIDPRTSVQLRRILTPSDILPPASPETPVPPEPTNISTPPPATPDTHPSTPVKKKRSRSTRDKTTSTSGAEQLTIDGILKPEQTVQTETASSATRTSSRKKKKQSEHLAPTPDASNKQPEEIDWNDTDQ